MNHNMEQTDKIADKPTCKINYFMQPKVENQADDNDSKLHCNLEIVKEEDDYISNKNECVRNEPSEDLKINTNASSSKSIVVWGPEYENAKKRMKHSLDQIIIRYEDGQNVRYYKDFKYEDSSFHTKTNTLKWKCFPMCNGELKWKQTGDTTEKATCSVTENFCKEVESSPETHNLYIHERMVTYNGYIYIIDAKYMVLRASNETLKYKCCRSNQCPAAIKIFEDKEKFGILGEHNCDLNGKNNTLNKKIKLRDTTENLKSIIKPVTLTPVKIIYHVPINFQSVALAEQGNFQMMGVQGVKNVDYIKFRNYVHYKKNNSSVDFKDVVSYICQNYVHCMCGGSVLLKGDRIIQYKDHYCEGIKSLENLNLDLNDPNTLFIYYNVKNGRAELCYKGLIYQRYHKKIGNRWSCSKATCGAFLVLKDEKVREPINHMCALEKEAAKPFGLRKKLKKEEKGKFVKVNIINQLKCSFEPVPVEEQSNYIKVELGNIVCPQQLDRLPGIRFKGILYQKHEQLLSLDGSSTFVCLKFSKCFGSIKVNNNRVIGYIDHTCIGSELKESPTFNPNDCGTLVIYNNDEKTCLELFYRGFTYLKDWGVIPGESLWICKETAASKCQAYLRLTEDEFVLESGNHICNDIQSMEQDGRTIIPNTCFDTPILNDIKIKSENPSAREVEDPEWEHCYKKESENNSDPDFKSENFNEIMVKCENPSVTEIEYQELQHCYKKEFENNFDHNFRRENFNEVMVKCENPFLTDVEAQGRQNQEENIN